MHKFDALIMASMFSLKHMTSLQVRLEALDAGGKWTDVEVPRAVRAIVILNVPVFSGGRDLWKHDAQARAAPKHANAALFRTQPS
jgi:Diacylglycerol kinase accessory domain